MADLNYQIWKPFCSDVHDFMRSKFVYLPSISENGQMRAPFAACRELAGV